MRNGIAGLFSRHGAAVESDQSAGDDATPSAERAAEAVVAPADFRFPWARAESSPAASNVRGFASVDDALPAADEEAGPLEVEVHEDRIKAAAQAFEQASVLDSMDLVTPATPVSSPSHERFADVHEALPTEVPPAPEKSLPLVYDPTSAAGDLDATTDEFEVLPEAAAGEDKTEEITDAEPHRSWAKSLIRRLFKRRAAAADQRSDEEEHAAASAVFLLAKFRAFYNEVIRFQQQKSEFTAGFATAIMDTLSESKPDFAAEGLSKRLTELLELQAAEAKWMRGEVSQRYPEAQYAMAALADELFANMDWDGQSAWRQHSLEQKLYRTRGAELELFRRIDRLLKDAPDSPVARDLARVYLLVLAAGFQGKWRPFGLTRPIAEYRRRLYEYIHSGDAMMLYASDRRAFPQALSKTLEGAAVKRFSAAQRWAAILVVLLVSYVVVAHAAWTRSSADLRDITARIKTGAAVAGDP